MAIISIAKIYKTWPFIKTGLNLSHLSGHHQLNSTKNRQWLQSLIAKTYKTLTLHKNRSPLEGFKEKQRKNVKKYQSSTENRTLTRGFSHQCSSHWPTTTHEFQDPHILPLYLLLCSNVYCSLYSTDHQLCAVRTPFWYRMETPPLPERSHN